MKLYFKNSDKTQDFVQNYWKTYAGEFAAKLQNQTGVRVCLKGEAGTEKEEVARFVHFATKPDTVLVCVSKETVVSGTLPPITGIGTVFVDGIDLWDVQDQGALSTFTAKYSQINVICGAIQVTPAGFSQVFSIPTLQTRGIAPRAIEVAVQAFRKVGKSINEFSSETRQVLEGYNWPGNDVELHSVMTRAAYSCKSGSELTPAKIGMAEQGNVVSIRPKLEVVGNSAPTMVPSAEEFAEGYMSVKKKWSESFERDYLMGALNRHGGNVSAAAREAKIDRSNFLRLLRKYAIKAQTFRPVTKIAA